MVQGRDRRPELGYKLALECRKNIIYPMKNKNSKFNNTHINAEGSVSNSNSAKVFSKYQIALQSSADNFLS